MKILDRQKQAMIQRSAAQRVRVVICTTAHAPAVFAGSVLAGRVLTGRNWTVALEESAP